MPRRPRALLLDLDDTLYPLHRYRMSGFAAVARHLADRALVDERAAVAALVAASRDPARQGRELDHLVAHFALPTPVLSLRRIVRSHVPALRLPPATRLALRRLRRTWRLAIVTNGMPTIQARKIEALGVDRLVHTVVFAAEHGLGEGKPEGAAFREALKRLDVPASRAVAVGDDEFADVFGAVRFGMRAVQIRQWKREPAGVMASCADAVVTRFSEVPEAAERLFPGRQVRRAA